MWDDYVYDKKRKYYSHCPKGDPSDLNVIYLGRFLDWKEANDYFKVCKVCDTCDNDKIKHLREVTSVMVEESSNGIECTKNRFGNRTIDGCKNVTFEKIELSKIDNDIPHIRKEYYGRNLWVVL